MSQERIFFYLVFLAQVLLVSGYLPARLASAARGILETCPPDAYPRLYAASPRSMERTLGIYGALNLLALVVGLTLIVIDWRLEGAILSWNGGTAVAGYMLLQFLPLAVSVSRPSFPYFSAERQPSTTRSAELRRRRLLDLLSPGLLRMAAVLYVALAVLVVVVAQYDYPWFGGYANLVGLTALYLAFGVSAWLAIRDTKRDPWTTHDRRRAQMAHTADMCVTLCIVWTSFLGLSILLRVMGWHDLVPAALSLVVTIAAFATFRRQRVEDVDFEVYREEPAAG